MKLQTCDAKLKRTILGPVGILGFTLVELLVVIAIVAVLAALAFMMAGNAATRASEAKATANFRQLGGVITSYAADNDGKLPGALYQGQRSGYNSALSAGIGAQLWQYMGLPKPTAEFRPVPLLTVPALSKWAKKFDSNNISYPGAYAVVRDVPIPGANQNMNPFGLTGSGAKEPSKLMLVPNPANTWAVWERGGSGDPISGNRKDFSEPIHGDKRTVLFFDGHVGVVPSDELPSYLNQ